MNKPAKTVKELIAIMAAELRPLVQEIEKSPEMTKGHYDRYMSMLQSMSEVMQTDGQKKLYIVSIIQAGGNREGVLSAVKILYPEML